MKEDYLNNIKKFKLKKSTKELLNKQVELFYSYSNDDFKEYSVGDEISLTKNTLVHGSRASLEVLKIIAENGLIASEFYEGVVHNKKKPYVVEFWRVYEDTTLSNWIKTRTGVTINFYSREGSVYKSVLSSFDDIGDNVKKEQGFRDYIIYQNQEQRYLPNDYIKNDASVAFILEFNDKDSLIKNDIFSESFDSKILKDLLPKWFYNKYMKTRKFDPFETGREKAILFGVPVSMIKGIMVSRELEKDKDSINKIRKLFPKCYICNLDGKVI